MTRVVTLRPRRWRRALAVGSIVTVWAGFVFPAVGEAATGVTYKDKFQSISFSGSDGTAAWAGPWLESGESDGPSRGAAQVKSDSHCASGNCMQIGAEDPDNAGAHRAFDSSGATSVVLSFDYVRHVSSSGSGSGGAGVVKLFVSSDSATWMLIDTYPMNVDDGSVNQVTYDLTAFAGPSSAIKFELVGGIDDGHINIDNVAIAVAGGVTTTTSSTTTPSTTAATTSTLATTTAVPSTTTIPPTTTTVSPTTTKPPATTTTTTTTITSTTTSTTAPPRTTTTTAIAVVPTIPRTTTTTSAAPKNLSPTPAETAGPSTTVRFTPVTTAAPSGPSTTVPPLTPDQAMEAKDNLVVAVAAVGESLRDGEAEAATYRLDPRQGLAVSFTSAVETLKGNLLNSILLGVTISVLLLLGIDKREEASLRTSPA